MLFLSLWGKSKDKTSAVLEFTLRKHTRVMNIGVQDGMKKQEHKSDKK